MIYRQKEHYATKKKFQGLEALDPSLGLIFPSQGLTLARQCIILTSMMSMLLYRNVILQTKTIILHSTKIISLAEILENEITLKSTLHS